eukprot:CAMPEP_0179111024 /NCGR_PEP_ID=MMETSP0796-20121207/51840_1 /TAXON_ID=73915 /ORGANISM="Pyrodinium bahamense, Strain pbaha01" /LENGTH=87 /DNA_ID=CAMNT_0020809169 /DNA_START=1 /DNA_END=261 /DNA_ORIENTATION=+
MIGFCLIDLVFDFLVAKGTWQTGDDYYDSILVAPHVNLVGSVLLMTGPLVIDHETKCVDVDAGIQPWCWLSIFRGDHPSLHKDLEAR